MFANSNPEPAQAANTYFAPFSDAFNRADGAVGNGWTTDSSNYSINSEKLVMGNGANWYNAPLLRPDVMSYGKIETKFTLTDIYSAGGRVLALFANWQEDQVAGTGGLYSGWLYSSGVGDLFLYISKTPAPFATASLYSSNVTSAGANSYISQFTTGTVRFEFVVEPVREGTRLTVNLYDGDDTTVIISLSYIDTTNMLFNGQWGLSSRGTMITDDVKIQKQDVPLTLLPSVTTIKYGSDVNFAVIDDQAQTVAMTDSTGGLFDSNPVPLDTGNNFRTNVIYEPQSAGEMTVRGTSNNSDVGISNVFVSPYSPAIGFIGDSLTSGAGSSSAAFRPVQVAGSILGAPVVNRGSGGSTAGEWVADNCYSLVDCRTLAFSAFDAEDVEIVHIMLGQNDLDDAALYKSNLEQLIQQIKDHGYRQVILSYPIHTSTKLDSFTSVIDQIVSEGQGYVLLGDTTLRNTDWSGQGMLSDAIHLNDDGYAVVGAAWASAIHSNLLAQINPANTWLNSDNTFKLGETGTLSFSIEKYIGELTGVTVDGAPTVLGTDYDAVSGSTIIELLNSYLNTLGAGTYTLNVQFAGGVSVPTTFIIQPDGTIISPTNPTIDLNAPATGLFNLGSNVSIVLLGILAISALAGAILVGRKLQKGSE